MSESTWNGLPFNLDDVVHRRRIEDNRVEYKATWNRVIRRRRGQDSGCLCQ